MGRSQESFNKKEVRNKKEKKRKEKEQKRLAKRDNDKKNSLDDMIAYVDENGVISSTPPDPYQKTEIEVEDIQVSTPKQSDMPKESPIKSGVVSFFNHSKGFGFILDSKQNKIFVHINNVEGNEIDEGDKVSFEVENGPRGLNAIQVKVV